MSKEPEPNMVEIGENLERLEDLLTERQRELGEKLSILGTTLIPIADPDGRIANWQRTIQKAQQRLPQKGEVVAELIQSHSITTSIDDVFLSEMLLLADRFLDTTPEKRDQMFKEHELEIVRRSVNSLNLRRLSEHMDLEGETEHSVEISSDRVFKFYLSEDGEKVRMDIPVVLDPDKYKVEIGSIAVYEILGDQLTREDYKKIAETLLALEGNVGRTMRAYYQAAETWAELYSADLPSSDALEARRMASYKLRKVVGGDEPRVAPFCDIPLNAIFLQATENYPQILNGRVPQPFES